MRYEVRGARCKLATIRKYVLARALALRYRTTDYRLQWGRGCQWQTEHPSDVL